MGEKILVCEVNNTKIGFSINNIISIQKLNICKPIPKMSKEYKGFTTYRGVVIPLIDIGILLFGNTERHKLDPTLLVLSQDEQGVGLLVDKAKEIIDLDYTNVYHVEMLGTHSKIIKHKTDTITIIDINNVLNQEKSWKNKHSVN